MRILISRNLVILLRKYLEFRMEKILILNKYYSPVIGGVETVVELYANHLSKSKKVKVLVCNKSNYDKAKSISVNNNLQVIFSKTLITIQKLPISIDFFWKFYNLCKWSTTIYLHEPFPLGMFALLFIGKKKKIVVTWHSDILNQKYLSYVVKPLQNIILRRALIITTTSENLLNYSIQLLKHRQKVSVIPLSIDIDKYKKDINNLIISDDILAIVESINSTFCLHYGRLSNYKGINVIIDVYRKYSSLLLPLVIAGEGEEESELQNLAMELPGKVYFINRYLSEDEKIYLITKSIFFVFPSNKITEAFGITQLESMVLSRPVINTNLPTGVSWVSLNEITGLTVEVNDIDGFYNAMSLLTLNYELRNKLGNNAYRRVVDLFSTSENLYAIDKIFNELSE